MIGFLRAAPVLLLLAACAPKTTPAPAAPAEADAIVRFRDRAIDLKPFLEGFPYKSWTPSYDAKRFFYMHDGDAGTSMLVQPLPAGPGELDVAKGAKGFAAPIDWAKRSFFGMEHHAGTDTMVVWSDDKNDEVTNLYRWSLADGTLTKVTEKPYVYGFGLDAKRERLAFLPRYGTPGAYKTCLTFLDWKTGAEEELACDEGAKMRFTWTHVSWRPDGSGAVLKVNEDGDRAKANLGWFDFSTKKLTPLLDAGKARNVASTLEEWIDADRFLYVSDETGFRNAYVFDLRSKKSTQVTRFEEDLGDWAQLAVGGTRYFAAVVSRPWESELVVTEIATGTTVLRERFDDRVSILDDARDRVYVHRTSVGTLLLIEEWTFASEGGKLVRRPDARVRPPSDLTAKLQHCNVKRVTVPTFDRELHAYLYEPKKPFEDPAKRFAVVTGFYGGGNHFDSTAEVLCAAGGYGLSPAVRGSSGFGREFASLNDKDLGGNEIVDVIYAARWLEKTVGLAPRQIGVRGGSHGGYATMRALTFPAGVNGRSDRFDFGFGLSHAGFSDIVTFYEKCNIPDWVKLEAGDPVAEKEKLLDRSPLTHVARLSAPLLLTHGENDNRVPVRESRQFAEKAKALGKPVTYVEFAGQGHGIKGIPNQKRLWQERFSFLERALDAGTTAAR